MYNYYKKETKKENISQTTCIMCSCEQTSANFEQMFVSDLFKGTIKGGMLNGMEYGM